MENQLNISSSPHIRSKVTSSNIMLMVTLLCCRHLHLEYIILEWMHCSMLIVTTATAVLYRVYL